MRFDIYDAWLTLAIPVSEEGTDLRGLIGAADAVNHAIPAREQVVKTVNRGLRAGLLEMGGGRFRLHPGVREEIARADKTSRVWLRQWDAVRAYLASREWPSTGTRRYSCRSSGTRAVEDYLRSFGAASAELPPLARGPASPAFVPRSSVDPVSPRQPVGGAAELHDRLGLRPSCPIATVRA